MSHMGDVCATCGTYQDQQGNAKSRFVRIGSWFENDKGELSVKLDALPMASLNPKSNEMECWLKLFVKKDDQQQQAPQQQQPPRQQQQQQQSQRRSRY